jgi:hypothetical protein
MVRCGYERRWGDSGQLKSDYDRDGWSCVIYLTSSHLQNISGAHKKCPTMAADIIGQVRVALGSGANCGSIAMDVDERCVVWPGARWVGRTGVI